MGNGATDEVLIPALSGFVSIAEQVIKDPDRWLGSLDQNEQNRTPDRDRISVARRSVGRRRR